MADKLVPHFANDQGAEKMGSDSQILCPYCSTLYVFTDRLAPDQTEPAGCRMTVEEALQAAS
jgi:hypothetical protein